MNHQDRILITGAGGYVGEELVKVLLSGTLSNGEPNLNSKNKSHSKIAGGIKMEDEKYEKMIKNVRGIYCFDLDFESFMKNEKLFELLEIRKREYPLFEFEILKGDIRDKDSLQKICASKEINAIFHLCSYGMSGKEMLANEKKIFEINVQGTENLIAAAAKNNIKKNNNDNNVIRIIYLSTYNVVFGSDPIINGDETIDYYPLEKHVDAYSKSKAIAEKKILEAPDQYQHQRLRTISLRPAAIYGERERRHLPRIMKNIEAGRLFFTIGDATVDWVHVSNLVIAMIDGLLFLSTKKPINEMKIESSSNRPLNSNIYFINDGSPQKSFDFLRPLCKVLKKPFPTLSLSVSFMTKVAFLCERYFLSIGHYFGANPQPFLCRAEVYKVGISHYFSIKKATAELGYEPRFNSDEGMKRVCRFYSKLRDKGKLFDYLYPNENGIRFIVPRWYWWVLINAGMILLALATYTRISGYGNIVSNARDIGIFVFQSEENLDKLFKAAVVAHLIEARIALSACLYRRCSSSTTILYTFQTLILGYPSLKEILSQSKKEDTMNFKSPSK